MSQTKQIIDYIRDFILACDFLQGGKVNVDNLGVDMSYSVNPLSCDPLVKKYIDGGTVKQFQFAFTSREAYDADARESIENSRFYQQFAGWIEQKDKRKDLPDIGSKKTPLGISVLQNGYLYNADKSLAQYEIQCRIEYEQEV